MTQTPAAFAFAPPDWAAPTARGNPSATAAPTQDAPTPDVRITNLVGEVVALENPQAAAQRLADGLADVWGGGAKTALGISRGGGPCRILAISRSPKPSSRAPTTRAIEAALTETLRSRQPLLSPTSMAKAKAFEPIARRAADLAGVEAALGLPLRGAKESADAAAVLVLGPAAVVSDDARVQAVASAPALAGLVSLLDAARVGGPALRWRRARAWLFGRGRWWAGSALALGLLVALLPVPDRVGCAVTMEPQARRYVAAPFEGTLEKTLVMPGDVVRRNQPLAQIDPRPLELELATLQAQELEAIRRRDAALATRQASAAQLASLDHAQAESKIKDLKRRLEQLTIRSPLDGVVVRGDLERAEGAPLKLGQSLFEIAPLEPMLAEIAVPEDEISHVGVGMTVRIRLAAWPGKTLQGTIARIHPRAEIRDDNNVFIAEAQLANADSQLRPGMDGDAAIDGRSTPLVWTLARRPLSRLWRWCWW